MISHDKIHDMIHDMIYDMMIRQVGEIYFGNGSVDDKIDALRL